MRRLLIALVLVIAISPGVYGQQECKDPDVRATFKEKYKEIGTSHPDFLQDATVILKRSSFQNIQWVGLYWEGPVSGALLAYDCTGKLLAIEQMGGVKSVKFFGVPRAHTPAVEVEDIGTGTGYYKIGNSIWGVINGKITKLWEHTKQEKHFEKPWENGIVNSFEVSPSDYVEPGWTKLTVDGVRKIFPPSTGGRSDYRLEKLPTESYCWANEQNTYSLCR
jgi:hypothetical protein